MIETEEVPIPGGAIINFRPIGTMLVAQRPDGELSPTSCWVIDPEELDKVIAKDTDRYVWAKRAARVAQNLDGNDTESE